MHTIRFAVVYFGSPVALRLLQRFILHTAMTPRYRRRP